MAIPERASDPKLGYVGIGLAQGNHPDHEAGALAVVLLLTEPQSEHDARRNVSNLPPPKAAPSIEYWPFWDLMAIWNSTEADNGLVILSLEAYERVGGSDAAPQLRKLAMATTVNDHLPLRIDNRRPVPVFHPYDSSDPNERKFHTAYAKFLGTFAGAANEKIWFSRTQVTDPSTGDTSSSRAWTEGDPSFI